MRQRGGGVAGAPKTEEARAAALRVFCRDFLSTAGPVAEWTPAKVAQFLEGCRDRALLDLHQSATGLSLADTFRKHGVRGLQLVRLDEFTGNQQLKAPPFSVASLGQRLKLLDAVKVLVEEEVEVQVAAAAVSIPAPGDAARQDAGGVAEMLGRTCDSPDSLKASASAGGHMATVPAWRSTAFPPSGWVDPGEAGRTVPPTELELEFVFGYSGCRGRGNLACNDAGEVIFPVSRVAVVFNIETRTQRFFLDHTDEVSAVAMHPDKITVATGEHGPRGTVFVWDSQSMERLALLPRSDTSSRPDGSAAELGVSALSFGGDKGELLAVVARDMMIQLWRWSAREMVAQESAGTGRVFAALTNPFKDKRNFTLVTAGTQSVRFWTLKGEVADASVGAGAAPASKPVLFGIYGSVGDFGLQQAAVSLACLDANTTVSGMQDGSIYIWAGHKVCKNLDPAHAGPIFDLAVADDFLLSASHDGKVHQWSLSRPSPARDRTVLTLLGTVDADELCRKMDSAHELRAPHAHEPSNDSGAGKENSVLAQPPRAKASGGSGASASYSHWDRRTPCVRALVILPPEGGDKGGAGGRYSIVMGLETNSIYLLVTDTATFGRHAECRSLLNSHAPDYISALCTHSVYN